MDRFHADLKCILLCCSYFISMGTAAEGGQPQFIAALSVAEVGALVSSTIYTLQGGRFIVHIVGHTTVY